MSGRTDHGVVVPREFDRACIGWHPHMDRGGEMAFINHFYFYLWDSDWADLLENQRLCALIYHPPHRS